MGIGMDVVAEREHELTDRLLKRLSRIDGVKLYGSVDVERVPRAGVVAFDVEGVPYGLVAAYLDDFHAIAVRDGCFCAHPYVKALLKIDAQTEASYRHEMLCGDRRQIPGMVRASLGVYSTEQDIEALGSALEELTRHASVIRERYEVDLGGAYRLRGVDEHPVTFGVCDEVQRWLSEGFR